MKRKLVAAVWSLAALAWVAIIGFKLFGDPSLKQWTIAVTAGALSLEVAFWITAAILGVSVWQGRKAVADFLMRPFRK